MSFTMSLGREDASSAYCKMWTFWKTEHFMLKSPRAAAYTETDVTPCSVRCTDQLHRREYARRGVPHYRSSARVCTVGVVSRATTEVSKRVV